MGIVKAMGQRLRVSPLNVYTYIYKKKRVHVYVIVYPPSAYTSFLLGKVFFVFFSFLLLYIVGLDNDAYSDVHPSS